MTFKGRKEGDHLGVIGGTLYIIFTSTYIPTDMLATNCEIIMLLFGAIGFYFLTNGSKRGIFLFGIFLGLSIFGKQQAAIWLFVLPITLILNRDRDLLISDLNRNSPLIIIDTSPSGFHHWDRYPLTIFEGLNKLIAKKYEVLTEIDGFRIYIKR